MHEELKQFRFAFGNTVKAIRIDTHLIQEELASRCDCHVNYISDVERGKRNIGINYMYMIAKGLNLSLSELVRKAEDRIELGTTDNT